jgi:hypothetical protein
VTTRATFDLETDDAELRALIDEARYDELMKWTVAVFVCSMLRDRALKAQGVVDHYDRMKQARAARKLGQALREGKPQSFREGRPTP